MYSRINKNKSLSYLYIKFIYLIYLNFIYENFYLTFTNLFLKKSLIKLREQFNRLNNYTSLKFFFRSQLKYKLLIEILYNEENNTEQKNTLESLCKICGEFGSRITINNFLKEMAERDILLIENSNIDKRLKIFKSSLNLKKEFRMWFDD